MEKEWKIAGVSLLVGMLAGLGIAYLIDRFGTEADDGTSWSPAPTGSSPAPAHGFPAPDGGGGI